MSLLKMSVLSLSGVTLWLLPPFVFSRKIPLHNFMQGIALVSGFACCFEARKGALKLAKVEEFEALKQAAIDSDMVHEISTSVYVSEESRKKEAEAILASSDDDVEGARKALEAMYTNDLQAEASTSEHPDYPIYLEVRKSMEAGKSVTWIVENVLKMGGRKFADGKAKLETLLQQFEGEQK
ncbi:hypothetical protein QUA82_15655 [Microcoleus sp. F8-D3]